MQVQFVLFCFFFYKRQHIVNVSPSRQPVPIMPISMRALGLHTITTTCYRVLHNYKTAKIAKNIVWNSLQLAQEQPIHLMNHNSASVRLQLVGQQDLFLTHARCILRMRANNGGQFIRCIRDCAAINVPNTVHTILCKMAAIFCSKHRHNRRRIRNCQVVCKSWAYRLQYNNNTLTVLAKQPCMNC